jgi:hypothetical protein
VSSNPRRAPVYFRLHRPTRAAGSGGATDSLCLVLYAIMFIELCCNFMSVFAYFYPPCDQLLSLCPASSLSCAILSQASLLEVPRLSAEVGTDAVTCPMASDLASWLR